MICGLAKVWTHRTTVDDQCSYPFGTTEWVLLRGGWRRLFIPYSHFYYVL